tara:strand:- start:612 stop:1166 length:555 start_codon:yes stop_codon:yes gene_type:complete
MAHFARIKRQPNSFTNEMEWTVQEVIVASNDIPTSNGPLGSNDMHVDGETYVANMFKHMYPENENVWKQTSYNKNFRNIFAGTSCIYLETADKFIEPQPHSSWYLNNQDEWTAPITRPTVETFPNPNAGQEGEPDTLVYFIKWDETAYQADNSKGWKAMAENSTENKITHEWDSDNLQWVAISE